jgi:putative transposase
MPTKDKWMLTYNLLDGIFKLSDNEDYRNLPAQVNQQVMKQCFSDWKSYLKSLKEYKKNPSKFSGKPKLPNYKEHDLSNAILTNIICKIKTTDNGSYLTFPKTKLTYNLGNYISEKDKLQQVEIKPYFNSLKLILIIKDIEYQEVKTEPSRVLGIDLGVNNFATISNNIGITPIIIKGKVMKERNQYFNKKKAELCGLFCHKINNKERFFSTYCRYHYKSL